MEEFEFDLSANKSVNTGADWREARDERASKARAALLSGSYETAGEILAEGLRRFPGDSDLLELLQRQRQQAQTFAQVQSLLSDVKIANDDLRFPQSLKMLQQAAKLSTGFSTLSSEVFDTAVAAAKNIAPLDWSVAQDFLNEATRINPRRVIKDDLLAQMKRSLKSGKEKQAHLFEADLESDLESGRQFTKTIGIHSQAINQADTRPAPNNAERRERLGQLRDDLGRAEEPEEADRILALSALELGPENQDVECKAIYSDILNLVLQCRSAVDALAARQTQECVEQCDRVLAYKPDHVLFLALRAKAKAAERSDQMGTVARIRALLDCGPMKDAQAAIKKAAALYPQSPELWELDFEIREKAIRVRNLVELGETRLQARDFEGASHAFLQARELLPFDTELIRGMASLVYSYARRMVERDWAASEVLLHLAQEIQPGSVAPKEIKAAINRAKAWEGTAVERGPSEPLDDSELMPEVLDVPVQQSEDAEEPPAAERIEVIDIGRRPGARPVRTTFAWIGLIAALVLAGLAAKAIFFGGARNSFEIPAEGTLTVRSNVYDAAVYINKRKYNLPSGALSANIGLAPEVYQVRGVREGYADFGPVTIPVRAGADTVIDIQLEPKPVALEIRRAQPGLEVMLDGHLLGAVGPDGNLKTEVSPGEHYVGLFRDGFIAKTIARSFVVGEPTVLSDSDVTLESSDASTLSEKHLPKPVAAKTGSAALKDFVSTLPPTLRASVPALEEEPAVWQKTNKMDAGALQAFLAKYPDGQFAGQAKGQMQALVQMKNAQAEIEDWNRLDHNSKPALVAFLARHPNGAHVALATGMVAEMDKRAASAEGQHSDAPAVSKPPADSAAVLAVIQRLADAWSARDPKMIASLRHDLDQRTLKEQLAPVKLVVMRISPVMPPQLDGTKATVVCRQQSDETFTDGSSRKNPESIVTYVLAKRDGVWEIEHVR